MITVKDYDEAYYLRPTSPWPEFDPAGPVRQGPASKVSWFSDLIPDRAILDVGCGRGEQVRVMAELGAPLVVGIDWSAAAIQIAKGFCRGLKAVLLCQRDARTYRPPIRFNMVTMFDFIEHLSQEDARAVYRQCASEWLAQSGWLCVICPPANEDRYHLYHQTQGSMRRDLEAAGLKVTYLKERTTERGYIYVARAYKEHEIGQRLEGGRRRRRSPRRRRLLVRK